MHHAKRLSPDKRKIDWKLPGSVLVVAACLVGLAIALDESAAARIVNGLGGLLWLVAAALLAWSLHSGAGRRRSALVLVIAIVVLAILVRPTDLVAAIVGFAVGGGVVALTARERVMHWTLLVPALWLPVHIIVGIARSSIAGAAAVRTEPPPTAAVVPLTMVLAAGAAGLLVMRGRGTVSPPAHEATPTTSARHGLET